MATFQELAEKAIADPSSLNDLPEDTITAMRRALNPAGGVVTSKKTFVNMSIINWSEIARRNQVVLSFIAFQSRMINEYLPEEDIERITLAYKSKIEAADDRAALVKQRDDEIAQVTKMHRDIARKVFKRNFEFDPDHHVRGSKATGWTEAERKNLIAKVENELNEDKLKAATAAINSPDSFEKMKTVVLKSYNEMTAASTALQGCIKALHGVAPDAQAILIKRREDIQRLANNLGKVARPLSAADCIGALEIDPPVDVFHQFERYMSSHYEHLNDLSIAYFGAKPDIEYMVRVYSAHDNEKDAHEYCKQHTKDFRAQVITVSSEGTTVLGSFRENRERVAYYSQETEVMRLMSEQAEADAKLGRDMMEKAMQKKKKANIRQEGPDKPGLTNYRNTGIGENRISDLGAKKISKEKMEQLEKEVAEEKTSEKNGTSEKKTSPPVVTERSKKLNIHNLEEHYCPKEPESEFDAMRMRGNYSINDTDDSEQPDDAICVQVHMPKHDADGNVVGIDTEQMYTQAEAPLHLQKNSPFVENYQPRRAAGADLRDTLTTTEVTGRDGQTNLITDIKK